MVIRQIVGYLNSASSDELTTNYTYDNDGNMTRMTTPSGVATDYQYDGFNRRTKTIRGS